MGSVSDDERYLALLSNAGFKDEEFNDVGAVDVGLVSSLKTISRLTRQLAETEGDAFEVENNTLSCKPAGTILRKLGRIHAVSNSGYKKVYCFEPWIDMAMKYFQKYCLHQMLPLTGTSLSISDPISLAKCLNCCVDEMRAETKSTAFASKVNNYQRSSNKNLKELKRYVDALFDSFSRLMVVRIDMDYSKPFSDSLQVRVKKDLKRLFENARSNKIFREMVGFIWKLEHGPEKGFHYHVMFFFNGAKVREDITMAERIGEYWKKVVTGGRGHYYNCNAKKNFYKNCGIGLVDYSDSERRSNLYRALIYLTKTDLYMKINVGGRSLGKGLPPRPKGARGRPRLSAENDQPEQ